MQLKEDSKLQEMKQTELYKYITEELHPHIKSLSELVNGMSKNQMSEDMFCSIIAAIGSGERPFKIIQRIVKETI